MNIIQTITTHPHLTVKAITQNITNTYQSVPLDLNKIEISSGTVTFGIAIFCNATEIADTLALQHAHNIFDEEWQEYFQWTSNQGTNIPDIGTINQMLDTEHHNLPEINTQFAHTKRFAPL